MVRLWPILGSAVAAPLSPSCTPQCFWPRAFAAAVLLRPQCFWPRWDAGAGPHQWPTHCAEKGACVGIPQAETKRLEEKACHLTRSSVASFPVGERDGMLWVWLTPGADAHLEALQCVPLLRACCYRVCCSTSLLVGQDVRPVALWSVLHRVAVVGTRIGALARSHWCGATPQPGLTRTRSAGREFQKTTSPQARGTVEI